MAEDLQQVANEIVDNVIDGVETELTPKVQTVNAPDSSTKEVEEVPAKKSLLCSMICPGMYMQKLGQE